MSSKTRVTERETARRRPQSPGAGRTEVEVREEDMLLRPPALLTGREPGPLPPLQLLRLQQTIGNRAVGRLLAGARQSPASEPPSRTIHLVRKKQTTPRKKKLASAVDDQKSGKVQKGRKVRRRKPSKAALTRNLKKARADKDWGFATGHTSSGQWTEEVVVRGAYAFDAQRVRQVLRHIATAVYHYAKSKVDAEQEVQALYVNDRLLLSSNLPASMAELKGLSSEQVFNIFLSDTHVPKDDLRALGDIHKLQALVAGTRLDDAVFANAAEKDALQNIAEMIRSAIQNPATNFPHCGLDAAATCITDARYDKNVIVVEGVTPVHAEQNLILAYARSGTTAPGEIYGKKRPCTGCYMTFVFATQKLGLNLRFNENPGGFWGPAEQGLWQVIQQKTDLKLEDIDDFVANNLPAQTYRTERVGKKRGRGSDRKKLRTDQKGEETGYDSPSDSEDEEMEIDKSKYIT